MMQIKEFCMKYKNCREGQEKERFIEKHILKDKYCLLYTSRCV